MPKGKRGIMGNGETRKLVRKLKKEGWRIEPTRKHVKAFPPEGGNSFALISGTPGGPRWKKNLQGDLNRVRKEAQG